MRFRLSASYNTVAKNVNSKQILPLSRESKSYSSGNGSEILSSADEAYDWCVMAKAPYIYSSLLKKLSTVASCECRENVSLKI